MLLIAPGLPEGLVVHLKGNPVSMPYMSMTVQLMQLAGIRVKQGKTRIHVHPGDYNPGDIRVESDWSAAAFWYETAVFATEVDLELLGLSAESFQGDSVLPMIYQNFGIRTEYTAQGIRLTRTGKKADGFYYDFTNFPDIAQAVIATCAGMGIRGRFEGLQSLQIKETDRVRAMKSELGRLGLKVSSSGASDQVVSLELSPGKPVFGDTLCFETYGDHRMAMALAPLAMKAGTVKILNPDVVGKSYPGFWEHMKSAGFDIR
jgi:3-phosphoshikimate 1-carboxyvinyltransferase